MTETLKKNDIVKVDETGKVGRITDIQYAFNRYLFKNVSGWQYGIDGLSKVEIDSLITTIESQNTEIDELEEERDSIQRDYDYACESSTGYHKEALRLDDIVESQKEEIAKLREFGRVTVQWYKDEGHPYTAINAQARLDSIQEGDNHANKPNG